MNSEFINAFRAGALDHLISVYGFSTVVRAGMQGGISNISASGTTIMTVLLNFIFINIMLGVFNLIPFPPLDGSKIIMGILPDRVFYQLPRVGRYSMFILLILAVTGVLGMIIGPITDGFVDLLLRFAFGVFGVSL